MLYARASKAPMPRRSGEAAYDMLATEALRKHICNTSSPRLPLTWYGSHPGRMERPSHGPVAHTSPRSNSKRREFATSVNIAVTRGNLSYESRWPKASPVATQLCLTARETTIVRCRQ